jgi:hypothetical protein
VKDGVWALNRGRDASFVDLRRMGMDARTVIGVGQRDVWPALYVTLMGNSSATFN